MLYRILDSDDFSDLTENQCFQRKPTTSYEEACEVHEWCRDQFGEPSFNIGYGPWYMSSAGQYVSFANPAHAFAFRVRWC